MFQHSLKSVNRFWIATAVGSVLTAQGLLGVASRPLTTAQISEVRPTEIETTNSIDRSQAAFVLAALGLGIVGFSWARSNQSAEPTPRTAKLDRHLLLLLHQDRAAAERLVDQMQRKHPEKSRSWCIEKVKYDLERDRH